MRILAITNLYPNPFEPNRATFNRQQFRALAKLHPLRVIAPIAWTDEATARWRGAAPLPADRRVTCDGIPVEHPRYWFPPKVLRPWYGHFFRRAIRPAFDRAREEFRPDVVLSAWAYPDGWAAVDLARRAGLPAIVKVHGCDVLWGLRQCLSRLPRTREALCGADGIIAVSCDLAENVRRFGADPARIRVIYDGIDAKLFHPGSRAEARVQISWHEEGPMVLFVGSLVPVKGLDILLDACERVWRRGIRFRCCLVGDGPLRPQLEQEAQRRGLTECVRFLGARPHDQLPDWFRAADLFVLPSRSEGVPCVLLEAMASGTPFVASKVGGIPEVAHMGRGRLVPPADAAALADTIAGQLADGSDGPAAPLRSHHAAAREVAEFCEEVVRDRRGVRAACGLAVC